MKGRSTLTNLLETLESWTNLLEEGFGIDVVYLDYRKAFDTVPHKRLLEKIRGLGLATSYPPGLEIFCWAGRRRFVFVAATLCGSTLLAESHKVQC